MPGTSVIEVTGILAKATEAMEPSQLIHNQGFTLLEAMSAVELGEPKMDTGMNQNKSVSGTHEELIQGGFAPLELSAGETTQLMDQILESEVSWYQGHFLAETVYTCLYLLDLERLDANWIIKAFCELTRLTCLELISIVTKAGVCEEEDFCVVHHGLPLQPSTASEANPKLEGTQRWLSFANTVIARLRKMEASFVDGSDAEGGNSKLLHSEEFPFTGKVTKRDISNIIARLEFRSCYLQSLTLLQEVDSESDGEEGAREVEKLSANALKHLDQIVESFSPHGEEKQKCFIPNISRAILPPIPPRVIQPLSVDEINTYFGVFFAHTNKISQMEFCKDLPTMQKRLRGFARSSPGPIARSLMAIACSNSNPKVGKMVCASIGFPSNSADADPELFCCFHKCSCMVDSYVKAVCHNPSQQHRKFKKVLRALNENMEQIRKIAESYSPSESTGVLVLPIIMNWLSSFTHDVAMQQLSIGFDIDIYDPQDCLMIYWYLEYLLTGQITAVREFGERIANLEEVSKRNSKSNRRSRKRVPNVYTPLAKDEEVMSTVIMLESKRLALNGIVRMLATLQQQGHIPKPELQINHEEQRYIQRFAHLITLMCPQPLSYGQYVEATDVSSFKSSELCDLAQTSFSSSLRLLSHLKAKFGETFEENKHDLEPLKRICMANSIAMNVMKSSRSEKLKCSFEFESRMLVLKLRS